jgi:hypothetical protein
MGKITAGLGIVASLIGLLGINGKRLRRNRRCHALATDFVLWIRVVNDPTITPILDEHEGARSALTIEEFHAALRRRSDRQRMVDVFALHTGRTGGYYHDYLDYLVTGKRPSLLPEFVQNLLWRRRARKIQPPGGHLA